MGTELAWCLDHLQWLLDMTSPHINSKTILGSRHQELCLRWCRPLTRMGIPSTNESAIEAMVLHIHRNKMTFGAVMYHLPGIPDLLLTVDRLRCRTLVKIPTGRSR